MEELKNKIEVDNLLPEAKIKEGHRAGFVNIVGNPNVGKSTLMNDLVGERISIITSKASDNKTQDNGNSKHPGIPDCIFRHTRVLKPKYKLQESMLGFSEGALTDADILLYVTDVVEDPEKTRIFLNAWQKRRFRFFW